VATFVGAIGRAFDRGERIRLGGFYGAVLLILLVGFGGLLTYGAGHPAYIGLGFLALSFGLRHAFDADHIAAIDNTTRKLLAQGKKPIGIGFFFSLGHSTVVFTIALLLALAVKSLVNSVVSDQGQLHNIGGLLGTGVSGTFLLIIGIINLITLIDIIKIYRRMQRGQYDRESLNKDLVIGGPFTKLFGWLFKFVGASWQMYPIGFLFGLGFDTATEVALLAISAGAAAKGLPFVAVIALPILFAGGMSLMDTTDGAFMSKAYSWAFSNPVRRVFYNMTITGLSVFVAIFVGMVEVFQLIATTANLNGGIWDFVGNLNFNVMGFVMVGAFIVAWAGAIIIYKTRHVEERWARMVDSGTAGGD
jgi:high-affinity nickel-transport protein